MAKFRSKTNTLYFEFYHNHHYNRQIIKFGTSPSVIKNNNNIQIHFYYVHEILTEQVLNNYDIENIIIKYIIIYILNNAYA